MNDNITMGPTPATISATRKYMAKKPIAFLLAILFLVAAILPVLLVGNTVVLPEENGAPVTSTVTAEQTPFTFSEKMDLLASAIETACYSDGTEEMHNLFLYGTWAVLICITVSSLAFSIFFLLMFLSVALKQQIRNCLLAFAGITSIASILVFIILHIYSSVVIFQDLQKTQALDIDAKAKDEKITEVLTYLLRNILVTAALVFYCWKFYFFAFAVSKPKTSRTKLAKFTKGYKSACVAGALVCCFFASTIALTWTFNFVAKTLLWILVLTGATSFAMVALLHDYALMVKPHKSSADTVSTESAAA